MRRFLPYVPALIALSLLCAVAVPTANAQDIPSRLESVDEDIHAQQSGDKPVRDTFVDSFQSQGLSFTGRSSRPEAADGVAQVSVSTADRDLPAESDRGERIRRFDWENLPVNPRVSHAFALRHLAPSGLPGGEGLDTAIREAPPGNRGQVDRMDRGSVTGRLAGLFPGADLASPTDWLRWALRFSIFGLVALLFVAWRMRKSRWPEADFPEVGTVTTLPSELPAPVVSVLGSREIEPQTYLSILLDMLQRGNLTITATSEGYGGGQIHSQVALARQFEPDHPWEKVVYDALPSDTNDSERLKSRLERQQRAIRGHLDEYLQSRGIFDGPPLQVMADQGQGLVAELGWFLAAVILAMGMGLWVNLWLPWWAGAAIGIPAALVFFYHSLDHDSGRLLPTPAGALEISRWRAFSDSLYHQRVEPSLDPSEPDPLLPYAVALDRAEQWVNNFRALPPWFVATGGRRIPAYRGFVGADSWDLSGGPEIKRYASSDDSGGRGGGGGVGDGGGGG